MARPGWWRVLVAVAALKTAGIVPERDVTVMAIRAEESVWFSTTYFGSRAAFGIVPPDALGAATGRHRPQAWREHLQDFGGDPQAASPGPPHLDPARVAAFLEVHIEQGPILEAENFPIGLVTAPAAIIGMPPPASSASMTIAAACRAPIGTTPWWRRATSCRRSTGCGRISTRDGRDMAFTVGKLFTDPAQHALTKIPGEVTFSLDLRSVQADLLVGA